MTIEIRPYDHEADYERVGRFLVETFEPGDVFANWLQPRWEYMHHHPYIEGLPLERIGMATEDGRLVGVAHFEHSLAFGYLQVRPGSGHVKPALVDWAEQHLGGTSRTLGRSLLGIFSNDFDTDLDGLLASRGFRVDPEVSEEHSRLLLDRPPEVPELPPGFRLQSLAEENDLHKVNRVLWRGFNHEGPAPEAELLGRRRMQQAPSFRRHLNVVAVAPNGEYASYAGIWHVPENRVAYVEPVATDPDYRRMGLGAAAVLECVRRVAAEGAEVAWVGSGQEFYRSLGLETMFAGRLWARPR